MNSKWTSTIVSRERFRSACCITVFLFKSKPETLFFPSPRGKINKNDEEIETPGEGTQIPYVHLGNEAQSQGLDFTSFCSFPPANVPPSAFLFTLEVGWVFSHSMASACKPTFHKSQSFSSVSEQEAQQDICFFFFFVTSKWLFRINPLFLTARVCVLPVLSPEHPSLSSEREIVYPPPLHLSHRPRVCSQTTSFSGVLYFLPAAARTLWL